MVHKHHVAWPSRSSTTVETHIWHFPVIAALAAVCVIGTIKFRAWE